MTRLLDASSLAVDNKTIVFNSLLPLANTFLLEGRTSLARRCVEAAVPYATAVRSQMRLAIAHGELQLEDNNAAGARTDFRESLRIADAAQVPPRYEHRGTAQLGLLRAALLAGDSAAALQGGAQALAPVSGAATSIRPSPHCVCSGPHTAAPVISTGLANTAGGRGPD